MPEREREFHRTPPHVPISSSHLRAKAFIMRHIKIQYFRYCLSSSRFFGISDCGFFAKIPHESRAHARINNNKIRTCNNNNVSCVNRPTVTNRNITLHSGTTSETCRGYQFFERCTRRGNYFKNARSLSHPLALVAWS